MAFTQSFAEEFHTGGFLVSFARGTLSFDKITLLTGNGVVAAGQVLGQITASGKYVPVAPGAGDGSQTAVAVNYADADTTNADQVATAVTREAEVNASELVWTAGMTGNQIATATTQLKTENIIAR